MTNYGSPERIARIQAEPFPQFGHQGSHRGTGAPGCPRERHHHHDEFCAEPTLTEWAVAGRTDPIQTRSRA